MPFKESAVDSDVGYGQPIGSTRIVVNLRRLNVVFRDFDTETVFVVFCGRSSNTGPDGFWGELLFSRVGISSIGIVSVAPNWLPDDDLPSAIEEILKLTRGRRVVTFGQGKGAYGALKYSNALDARAAIAFSPRSFIDRSAVRELHQHPVALHGPDQQNGSSVTADDLSKDIYLFMDPYSKPDVRHTDEILRVARPPSVVHIVRVPFGKQDSLTRISEDGALHELIRRFMSDAAPQGFQLRNLIRAASKDSPVHREHLVDLLIKRLTHSSRFLEKCVNFWTPRKALLIGVLLLIRHGQHDRAAIQLDELDDATLSLAPASWMRRYFRLMNFSVGLKRLPQPPEPKTLESVPAQMRAINAWISDGQLDSAITALDHAIQSSGTGPHLKRLLYFARRLEHIPVLERLLADPAFCRQSDPQTLFDVSIELAQIYSRRKDDDGIRRALGSIDIGTLQAPLRRRLLDALALMDSQKGCLEFARDHLRFSNRDLEYLTLHRTVLLNESKPKLARAQLTELVKRLSNDSQLWEIASQLFASQANTHAAIGAQRNAIRFAAKPVPHEMRLCLAGLYTDQQRHLCSRLQLMLIRFTPTRASEELRPSRDFAVRHGYFRIAAMFAKTLCKANPQDLEALIALCWIYCRMSRKSKAGEIATRNINEIDNGGAVSRASWPILVQSLLALGRNDEARRMLGRGLDAFPNNKALLKISDALDSVKDLVSRINAR